MEPKPLGNFQPPVPLPTKNEVEKPGKKEEATSKIAIKSLESSEHLDKTGKKIKENVEKIDPTPPSSTSIQTQSDSLAASSLSKAWTFGLTALATAATNVAGYFFIKDEVIGAGGAKSLQTALSAYYPDYLPTENLKNLESYSKSKEFEADARSAKIYYNSKQLAPEDALRVIYQREPTNIAMQQLYNKQNLKKAYGYEQGIYNDPSAKKKDGSSFKDMSNTASIYSQTRMWKPPGGDKSVHIACLSLPAPALDTDKQSHFSYYVSDGVLVTKNYKEEMQFLFKTIETVLRDNLLSAFEGQGIKRVVLSQFGQGSFLAGLSETEKEKARVIFLQQLDVFLDRIKDTGIPVVLCEYAKTKNSDSLAQHAKLLFGNIIETAKEHDLIINPLGLHSAPGCDNDGSQSFDGAMGMSCGLLLTQTAWINPHLKDRESLAPVMQEEDEIESGKKDLFSLDIKGKKGEPDEIHSKPILKDNVYKATEKNINILKISLSEEQEPNKEIHAQANKLIAIMENGAKQLINEGIDFETAEKLKQSKNEAKKILKDSTSQQVTKDTMRKLIRQYDDIVESISVLKTLQQISREIRNPVRRDNGEVNRPTLSRFRYLLGNDREIVSELADAYKEDKTAWKEKWGAIRKKMWDVSFESEPFIQQGKKITWVTGSKSSTIPSILKIGKLAPALSKKPALVPTGQLMKHNIVPLAGVLGMGITDRGINQIALSGASFEYLSTCIGYATEKDCQFDADEELENILKTERLNFIFNIPRLRVSVLRLLLMGAHTEAFPKIQEKLQKLIEQEPIDRPMNTDWVTQAALIGKTCPTGTGTLGTNQELQVGQIVGVPRSDFNLPKYGIVVKKNENGSYTLIVDKTYKTLNPKDIIVIPKETLTKAAESLEPLSESERSVIEKNFETNRQKLKSILNLFGTINPFKFDKNEMELIQQPFPIVWGSLSTSLPVTRVDSAIIGEVAVKGALELGKDIQVIFTNCENVAKLQECLKGQDVHVLSFEAAYFIQGRQQEEIFDKIAIEKIKSPPSKEKTEILPPKAQNSEVESFYRSFEKIAQRFSNEGVLIYRSQKDCSFDGVREGRKFWFDTENCKFVMEKFKGAREEFTLEQLKNKFNITGEIEELALPTLQRKEKSQLQLPIKEAPVVTKPLSNSGSDLSVRLKYEELNKQLIKGASLPFHFPLALFVAKMGGKFVENENSISATDKTKYSFFIVSSKAKNGSSAYQYQSYYNNEYGGAYYKKDLISKNLNDLEEEISETIAIERLAKNRNILIVDEMHSINEAAAAGKRGKIGLDTVYMFIYKMRYHIYNRKRNAIEDVLVNLNGSDKEDYYNKLDKAFEANKAGGVMVEEEYYSSKNDLFDRETVFNSGKFKFLLYPTQEAGKYRMLISKDLNAPNLLISQNEPIEVAYEKLFIQHEEWLKKNSH